MKPKVQSVLIAGYYGFQNAGDELILHSLIQSLKKEFPNAGIKVLSSSPKETTIQHGVPATNRWNPFSILSAFLKCDLFVLGGGGILQDASSTFSLWYYLSFIWLGVLFNKPVRVESIGVGPILRDNNRFLTQTSLAQAQTISVRDYASLRELNRIQYPAIAKLKCDPVLLLDINKPTTHKSISDRKKIFFIPRAPINESLGSFDHSTNWIDSVLSGISQFTSQIHADLVIYSFHPPLDQSLITEIKKKMDSNLEVLEWKNMDSLLEDWSRAHGIISMRYHGALLGTLLQIPTFGIAGDSKIENFFEEIPATNHIIRKKQLVQLSGEALFKRIMSFWHTRESSLKLMQRYLTDVRRRVTGNIE